MLSPEEFAKLLMDKSDGAKQKTYDISQSVADQAKLKQLAADYDAPPDYVVGDLIEWKPGLEGPCNKFPAARQPVICRALGHREVFERSDAAAIRYSDLTFGILEHGGYLEYFDDSRRFRKYRQASEQAAS